MGYNNQYNNRGNGNFNGGRKNFNNNNGERKPYNNRNRENSAEFEAKRAEQIARQTKSLEVIDAAAGFLDNFLKTSESYKVTMKDVLTYLNTDKGYSADDTKVISQFNYLMMDLANARKNPKVTGERLNIRVMYIEERFKTSFKDDLHSIALNIIKKYDTLFHWDTGANAENYDTLSESAADKA